MTPLPRMLVVAVLHAADWLLGAHRATPTVPLFDLMDKPHPQPCIEPVWALTREPGDPLTFSLVPTADGRLALFAADMEDFVGVCLDRADVQQIRHAITGWLCDTAAVIGR